MLTQIIQHAPFWVWLLLAKLVALGVWQAFPRSISLPRATIIPVAMVCLSLYGVTSVFGSQPLALLAWAAGLAGTAMLAVSLGIGRGVSWSAREKLLQLPGSWWPLAVILGIFVTKFAVGATLAMHPAIAHDTAFATTIGLLYGAFSGIFLGRAAAMWKVAQRGLALAA